MITFIKTKNEMLSEMRTIIDAAFDLDCELDEFFSTTIENIYDDVIEPLVIELKRIKS